MKMHRALKQHLQSLKEHARQIMRHSTTIFRHRDRGSYVGRPKGG
ncbi:hypothetical protein [Trichothermofontia sp.]